LAAITHLTKTAYLLTYRYAGLFSFCGKGPRSRSYGRTAALRLIVQPCDKDERLCVFFHFPSNEAPVE
jgi:hypothetical protein